MAAWLREGLAGAIGPVGRETEASFQGDQRPAPCGKLGVDQQRRGGFQPEGPRWEKPAAERGAKLGVTQGGAPPRRGGLPHGEAPPRRAL